MPITNKVSFFIIKDLRFKDSKFKDSMDLGLSLSSLCVTASRHCEARSKRSSPFSANKSTIKCYKEREKLR